MKKIIGIANFSHLPQKFTLNKINISDEEKITNKFNKFLENIGIELAIRIPLLKLHLKPA